MVARCVVVLCLIVCIADAANASQPNPPQDIQEVWLTSHVLAAIITATILFVVGWLNIYNQKQADRIKLYTSWRREFEQACAILLAADDPSEREKAIHLIDLMITEDEQVMLWEGSCKDEFLKGLEKGQPYIKGFGKIFVTNAKNIISGRQPIKA